MGYVKWRILENVGIPLVKVIRQDAKQTRMSVLTSVLTDYQKGSVDPKTKRPSQRAVFTRSLRDYHKGSSESKPYCSLHNVLVVTSNFRERPAFNHIAYSQCS
jgi:hypothetical protein